MTSIYIVRHCEALGNVMRIFQGLTDLDISENGAKQLEYLKERFSGIQLDKVYSSPLIRTRKTAPVKPVRFFVERNYLSANSLLSSVMKVLISLN